MVVFLCLLGFSGLLRVASVMRCALFYCFVFYIASPVFFSARFARFNIIDLLSFSWSFGVKRFRGCNLTHIVQFFSSFVASVGLDVAFFYVGGFSLIVVAVFGALMVFIFNIASPVFVNEICSF